MILTGKAKEDFIKHYDNHSIKFLLSWTDFDDLPVIVQNALIVEWFDSVGLYIQVQRHYHPEIVFDSYVLIDTKVFGQSEMSNFENRNKATEEAIKEANKIYNHDTM